MSGSLVFRFDLYPLPPTWRTVDGCVFKQDIAFGLAMLVVRKSVFHRRRSEFVGDSVEGMRATVERMVAIRREESIMNNRKWRLASRVGVMSVEIHVG